MRPASYVIVNKETSQAVFETFSKKIAESVNLEKYLVLPILEYLTDLNRKIRNEN